MIVIHICSGTTTIVWNSDLGYALEYKILLKFLLTFTQILNRMSKYVTQNYRLLKMRNQNNRLSNTPKALLSLILIILTSCFGLFNKYIHRYRTAFPFFCRKRTYFFNNKIIISPYHFRTIFTSREQCFAYSSVLQDKLSTSSARCHTLSSVSPLYLGHSSMVGPQWGQPL